EHHRDLVMIIVFFKYFSIGLDEIKFTMDDIRNAIAEVSEEYPGYIEKNVADVRYQYTSGRRELPSEIDKYGPWMIEGKGKANYAFIKIKMSTTIDLSLDLSTILIPDATPEIVLEYAGSDEQGLLAKLRYNRLLDIFLGITCYHLQNHWRTSIKDKGQIEVDDLYVGINTEGRQYVVPVEAKCKKDHLSKTQILQMINFSKTRFPKLIIRPIGIQESLDNSIIIIEFTPGGEPDQIKIKQIRKYQLVAMADCPINENHI
ncbi:endonuclease, partial [candidate division KSB1 bacterium]|nr:endonuclease [candidate division KSB1 bacterium]